MASVTAADAADVVAVSVELANPAAAAIAITVVGIGVAGRRGGDQRAGGKADTNANTVMMIKLAGVGFLGGGGNAAGQRNSSDSEGGNFGLDRHETLYPCLGRAVWTACQLVESWRNLVRAVTKKIDACIIVQQYHFLKCLPRDRRFFHKPLQIEPPHVRKQFDE